jgi:hypothetical protein
MRRSWVGAPLQRVIHLGGRRRNTAASTNARRDLYIQIMFHLGSHFDVDPVLRAVGAATWWRVAGASDECPVGAGFRAKGCRYNDVKAHLPAKR